MNAPKFTPGPWVGCIRFSPIGMDVEFNLAWLTTEPGSERDIEARANARLIRAAPELYDLLATHPAYAADTTFAEIWQWLARKEAVLAKASGIETRQGGDPVEGRRAEHESPTGEAGDAQTEPSND